MPVNRQNGFIESFNGDLRDEFLSLEIFDSMWEITTLLEDQLQFYNHYRPHNSFGYLTPVEFRTRWCEEAALCSQEVDQ